MSDMVERARELERQLTREELDRAFATMRANGWGPNGSVPPPWCWIEVFSGIIAARESEASQ